MFYQGSFFEIKDQIGGMSNFSKVESIQLAITNKFKFAKPTHCQSETFKQFRAKKDILLNARTGSGKTLAYLIPLLESQGSKVILTPTEQLSTQIKHIVKRLQGEDVLVGTPKYVCEQLEKNPMKINHLILDEADLIFLFNYNQDVMNVAKYTENVQTVVVSATVPSAIMDMETSTESEKLLQDFCKLMLKNPYIFEEKEQETSLKHYQIKIEDKSDLYLHLYFIYKLKLISGKSLIFTNHIDDAYGVKVYFSRLGINADILCPTFPINVRTATITQFNSTNKAAILIVVDHFKDNEVLSRGIDFQRVVAVLNLNVPNIENYRHRAGRAGRAKRTGICMTFTTEDLTEIKKYYEKENTIVENYEFNKEHVSALKYRHEDIFRSVTKRWILEAKKLDIQGMILKSKSLQSKTADEQTEQPNELKELNDALSKGKLHFQVKPSLKHVPGYLLPNKLKRPVKQSRKNHKKHKLDPLKF
eukprot:NODE_199_length_13192_cov_0.539219.p3 type:complete len:475 gc:universal NODE_199_length_13192_cov_0.539219:10848-12272(+)